MLMYIPEIGDKIELIEDFKFFMQKESRNHLDLSIFGTGETKTIQGEFREIKFDEVIIPKGSILQIDRIYIRQKMQDFSSITFYLNSTPDGKSKRTRFWAKLQDVNTIQFKKADLEKDPVFSFSTPIYHPVKYTKYISSIHKEIIPGLLRPISIGSTHGARFDVFKIEFSINNKLTDYTIEEEYTLIPVTDEQRVEVLRNYRFPLLGKREIVEGMNKAIDNALVSNDHKFVVKLNGEVIKRYSSIESCKKYIKKLNK